MAVDIENLKKRRIQLGLSQQDVADRLGITVRAYQYYEQGIRSPNKGSISILERLFGQTDENTNSLHEQPADKEKALLQKIIDLQQGIIEKERGIDFREVLIEVLIRNQAYLQVLAQRDLSRMAKELKRPIADLVRELEADLNKVQNELQKSISKQTRF
jgi:transcriptional regulator with XRE-family HTH domain